MIALQGGSATIGVQPQAGSSSTISVDFVGARKVSGTAGPELPGKVNYLRGNDPKKWRFDLPTYSSVSYKEIYPGIDVEYRGNQRQMEFDLVLRPGADPKQVRLKFGGARELSLDPDGALVVRSEAGDLRIPLPSVYQGAECAKATITGNYVLLSSHEAGFRLDAYDRSKPLVIDPTIVYAGLIGGGTNTSVSYAIAVDSNSNAYIAGYTYASDFPTANAAFPQMHTTPDGFVSKIDPTGTMLLYSTYIGGSSYDYLRSIAVDSTGAAWVTGYTSSVDFPVLNAYQSTLNTTNGAYDAVVLKLSASGGLLYSTYLGSGAEGEGIAVDPSGNAYAAGYVYGTVPTTSEAYLTGSWGGYHGFVTKFNSSGAVVYSTYLAGNSTDYAWAIAADASGNAYVTGESVSTSFPNVPAGGAQPSNAGGRDAFVAKLNPAGSALVYFTFLGGNSTDAGEAIAVDSGGNAYVGGFTYSTNFPATPGALQTASGGGEDGFVAKLNSAGSAFSYVTYLGGSRQDYVQGLAIDGSGNAYVTGSTDSAQFPTAAAIEGGLSGNSVSLYETTNSATSWAPDDSNIPGAVTSISPDPTAGTMVVATEAGMFRTVNSGQSWTMTNGLTSAYLSRSAANVFTIYAITCCASVYRSTDGGQTWTYQGNPSTTADRIVADPSNANTAYAYYAQRSYALQKTTDGGVTWNPATSGLPSSTPYIYSIVAASNGSLYVDISGYGVYQSTDQGAAWVAVNTGLGSFSSALNGLAVSASNPAVLYKSVNGGTIYTTTNGGTSWSTVSGSAPVGLGALALSGSDPSLIYAAANSGFPALYVSPDGGTTWNPAGTGLGIASLTQIVADPTNGAGAYALAGVTTAAFVSKINPTGGGLIYSTYLGSASHTYGAGIAVNGSGDAFVTGYNYGAFPATSTALPSGPNSYDAFVVRISGATASCSFSVSPATQLLYSSAATFNYSVVAPSGCAWTAVSNQSWATVALGASGSGSGLVSVGLSANNTGASRTATLTIGGQGVTLTQAPSSCSDSLGTSNVSVGASGGTVQTTVSAGTGCPWSVVSNYPFAVSVISGASGNGNGTVVLSVAPTAQETARTLNVSIGNTNLSISQAGYCTYVLSPASILLSGTGGSGSVTVTTQSGCAWTASSNNTSWLTVTSGSSRIGSGTVNYTAAANAGANESTSLSIGGTSVSVTETYGQAYLISTLAGGLLEPPTAASATGVSISLSYGVAVDSSGNVYFPSPSLNAVFKANTSGVVTRIAGTGSTGYSGDGGLALGAQLNSPNGVAVDSLGNIYIADSGNYRIRKVATTGAITTVAGNGGCCNASGDGGPATSAQLYYPQDVAVDTSGNLYISDTNNQRIRKVAANGIITTVAGNGNYGYSGDGGPATSAELSYPQGVAVDASGNLYIADTNNNLIREVTVSGTITTVAGNGNCCGSGDGGPAIGAELGYPQGVAVDASGNLYIADSSDNSIRKVMNGIIATVAGNGGGGDSGDGGPATSAQIGYPEGVAVDASGNLYLTDTGNERIRVVSAAGTIGTLVGGTVGDGRPGIFGALNYPQGVVRDSAANTYIADTSNNRVRKVAANGTITTVAGTGSSGFSGDGGPATSAQLNYPEGLALDSSGNLYIGDSSNQRVRKVASNGIITTVAGNGGSGYSGDGGAATRAALAYPDGVAVDSGGNLYIADSGNQVIRKVASNGIITTIAGNGTYGYSGDGGPATSAELNYPEAVAVDSGGNMYIADTSNNRIRKVSASGTITTVAGNGNTCCSLGDGGPATSAELGYPQGVAVDAGGFLYIADSNNSRIRKVDLSGNITTIAGTGGYGYTGDGGPALSASFEYPASVFVDAAGNAYVADQSNDAIRLLTPNGTQPVLTVQSAHTGNFTQGQNGTTYSVTVSNASGAGPASGTVMVTEMLPSGLTLASTSGTGWTCSSGSCTRSDGLSAGSSYSAITVTVNVSATAPNQVTNQATASVGGAPLAGAEDFTIVNTTAAAFTACDLRLNGIVNVVDVQLIVNQALGVAQAVNDLNGDGAVNVVDVQIEINAALGLGCVQ
jgi:sugar lactone lactonase YvrE